MAALCTFSFKGFTIRPAMTFSDCRLARNWTQADPEHRDTTNGGFWLEQCMGTESYVMEDREGVIFFFKLVRAPKDEIELHIQFAPPVEEPTARAEMKERTMRGLILGLEWMERALVQREIAALFFVSKSQNLIRFAKKHCGFVEDGKRFIHRLA